MGGDPSQFVSYGKTHSPTKRVFLTYTAAVSAGYPVCYDFDSTRTYQNATTTTYNLSLVGDARRICVEKPSAQNNLHFAGVIAHDYAANTGGQWIEIYPPGSICNIRINSTTTVTPLLTTDGANTNNLRNTGQMLTFGVNKWYFKKAGFPGTGSATILQNISGTAPSAPATAWAELQTGPQSGGYQEYTNYTGTVNGSTVNSVITRGGVTEIVTAIDGTDAGGHQTISASYLSLTAGDYIGQQKLFYVNAAAAMSLGYFIISIAAATTRATSATDTDMSVVEIRTAIPIAISFSTDGTNDTDYALLTWNGRAWYVEGTQHLIS